MTDIPNPDTFIAEGKTIVQRLHENALGTYRAAARVRNADLFEAAMRAAHMATIARVAEILDGPNPIGQTVDTIDGPMTIAHVDQHRAGDGVTDADVVLTADGMPADRTGWHTSDDDPIADWVQYEAWTLRDDKLTARTHGFVHRGSSKLTQVG